MKFSRLVSRSLIFVTITLALAALGTTTCGQTQMPPQQAAAQASPAVSTQPPSVCGGQPFCYETADFAAVVTDFRTSKSGYFGLIATTLRFVNKTSNVLILGYANGSGTAQDDSGLRYGVGGANALRGMGLVNGPSVDPKFVLQPGGFGDARFELVTRLTPVYGVTFVLNLTVNEINSLEGNQHTVGGEFPLEFQGLTNGARGTAPGAVVPSANGTMASGLSGLLPGAGNAAPACGPGGTVNSIASATNSTTAQNAANSATSTASNAASALSNITSLFGKKKKPADATNAAGNAPCIPASAAAVPAASAVAAVNSASQSNGTVAAPIAGTVPVATQTPNATNTPAGTAKAAVVPASAVAAATNATARSKGTVAASTAGTVTPATPTPTVTTTPAAAAKAAVVNAAKPPAQPAKPPAKKPAPATPPAQKPAQAQQP